MPERKIVSFFVIVVIFIALYIVIRNYSNSTIPTPSTQISSAPQIKTQTDMHIIFPSGGEKLIKGKTYTLKWTAGIQKTQIFLIDTSLESQGESVSTVDRVYGVNNTGLYSYTIPKNLKEGTYKFEIDGMTSKDFQIISANP